MNDEPLYLIAHKVRGKPSFDIAIQMVVQDEDEPWWILPSTGHRAYPYWSMPLYELTTTERIYLPGLAHIASTMPADLPDFYRQPDAKLNTPADHTAGRSLLESLGLLQPTQPFVRRV